MRRPKAGAESGYILLMLILMTTMMMVALAIALPRISTQIRRDREMEMIHRGEQYERAIQRYYRKYGRYPMRLEELENTDNLRFLRRRYTDPMSQGGTWRLLHVGEVQMGTMAMLSAASQGGTYTAAGSQSGVFQTTGSQGADAMGGGPIIGVASVSNRKGVHEFNGKSKYSEWYFVYDPSQDHGIQMHGPYNPNAYFGKYLTQGSGMSSSTSGGGTTTGTTDSGSSGTTDSGSMPNIPGVSGSGGLLGN
jgi:type II secretory pathway pseudopilin PulG